ncbi:MAG: pseudouridine synthase [Clostridiaceae bacterium]|nr:pseudouridine synthase [Clostridiaceae bacterium]
MRLDRCLANSGYGSRQEIKKAIRLGLVQVNGETIQDSGFAVDDHLQDNIVIDGKPACLRRHIHLMMNKPAGLITAMDDPRLPTIAGLIPAGLRHTGLFPVGRLDRDATGLLLLTNDGTLGHRLASPRWEVWKTYRVTVEGCPFTDQDPAAFAAGLILPDGQVCRPAKLDILGSFEAQLTIHEGKYHQVKRMMLGTGRKVVTLHRQSIGSLILDEKIAPGEVRELTEQEQKALYELVGWTDDCADASARS